MIGQSNVYLIIGSSGRIGRSLLINELEKGNNVVGIDKEHILPIAPILYRNYPNPFNSNTAIAFYLSEPAIIDLSIIDLLGNTVKKLIHEKRPAGNSSIYWDGKNMIGENVTSGIYFFLLKINGMSLKRKMVLLK